MKIKDFKTHKTKSILSSDQIKMGKHADLEDAYLKKYWWGLITIYTGITAIKDSSLELKTTNK